MKPDDGHPERWRYRALVHIVIAASGQDQAVRVAQEISEAASKHPNVVRAFHDHPSHANDLDGAFRVLTPPPIQEEPS